MRIIDLEPRYENSYLACFEEWSSEMKEAGNHKCQWYAQMKDKGLRVKIAVDEQDRAYGMIQYVPIELSPVKGQEMYFIDCIWVHGHKEGLGNMQKQGTGVALIKAAEKDVQSLGAKGMVAWGLAIPVWMKASWYKKQGYKKIDRNGMAALLWKPFSKAAVKPSWIKTIKQPQANANPGKVTVVAFYHPKCQSPLIMLERTRKAVKTFGDQVVYEEFNTSDRDVFLEWGITDGLFIEGKDIYTGPPVTYEKIIKAIRKNLPKKTS